MRAFNNNTLMKRNIFKQIPNKYCALVVIALLLMVQSIAPLAQVNQADNPPEQCRIFTIETRHTVRTLLRNQAFEPSLAAKIKSKPTSTGSILYTLLNWIIPPASAAIPPPPGGPILIITSGNQGTIAAPDFSNFYAEILRTEGFNEFSVAGISTVTGEMLALYDVVILAKTPLTDTQVQMLSAWVANGGNLIAMRPDKQLAPLLGLTDTNTTLNNGYLLVNTSRIPGNGITGQTMQFHGIADRYSLKAGTINIAKLYNNASSATANPAVSMRNNIGPLRTGQAAAFAFDLAASIVYTRQGNPAWASQERDGFSPIRSDDKFFGQATGDPQTDWIDFNKIAIPQADEQQRLLGNMIIEMNRDRKPLPRFWYFPRDFKAAVIMTGDDHANNGTQGRFDYFIAQSPAVCSVRNWQCVRGTSYLYPATPLTAVAAANYNAQGFEVGLHINTLCANFTPATLEDFYVDQIQIWTAKYNNIPAPVTQRHHCVAWSDWASGAKVQLDHGIRLDTSYYFFPPSWILNRPGFFSGSGMPMRFSDLDGTLIDVYSTTTQMSDESGQGYPYTINKLLDSALGDQGYYGAFTINAHTDVPVTPEATATVTAAKMRGVPIVTSRQLLNWFDHRNQSSFSGLAWSGNTLLFSVVPGPDITKVPVNALQVLLPLHSKTGKLTKLTRNGVRVTFASKFIKGLSYAAFPGISGNYAATYTDDNVAPTVVSTVPPAAAVAINPLSAIEAAFNETINPSTITTKTFELRNPQNALIGATAGYNANALKAVLTPKTGLAANTIYTATLKGGTTDPRVKDVFGNALAANVSWTFTTGESPCAVSDCSAWPSNTTPGTPAVNDPNSIELGVKFRSDLNGLITGVRFYQTNPGVYQAAIWNLAGEQLALGSVTSTSSGWQQVNFSTPLAITANTVYIASYHAPNGNYAANNNPAFAIAGVDNPPIHLLVNGENGSNGLFQYSASSTFPTESFQSNNYWVDVVFRIHHPPP